MKRNNHNHHTKKNQPQIAAIPSKLGNVAQDAVEQQKLKAVGGLWRGISLPVRSGLNSHYFHIIGDGHQPNSRGVYIPIITIHIKGEMTIPNIGSLGPGTPGKDVGCC